MAPLRRGFLFAKIYCRQFFQLIEHCWLDLFAKDHPTQLTGNDGSDFADNAISSL
jgi:hypothetical protein